MVHFDLAPIGLIFALIFLLNLVWPTASSPYSILSAAQLM